MQGVLRSGEVTAPLCFRGNKGLGRASLPSVPESLIGAEGKELVFNDWTSSIKTKLVLPLFWTPGLKETACIEKVVAKELPDCAVKLIGPCFGGHADVAPRITTKFGSEIVRLKLNFLNGIRWWVIHPGISGRVVKIGAIEIKLVHVVPAAVHIHFRSSPRFPQVLRCLHAENSRQDSCQSYDVATVDRKIYHALIVHQA